MIFPFRINTYSKELFISLPNLIRRVPVLINGTTIHSVDLPILDFFYFENTLFELISKSVAWMLLKAHTNYKWQYIHKYRTVPSVRLQLASRHVPLPWILRGLSTTVVLLGHPKMKLLQQLMESCP